MSGRGTKSKPVSGRRATKKKPATEDLEARFVNALSNDFLEHGAAAIAVTTGFGLSCVTLFGEDWERKDGKVFELEGLPPQQVH